MYSDKAYIQQASSALKK